MTKLGMLGAVAHFSVLAAPARSSIPTPPSKGRVAPTTSWETPIPSRRIMAWSAWRARGGWDDRFSDRNCWREAQPYRRWPGY